ncbi:hypothetical protein HRM2_32040 [Desulforapulum autotrophicum HRM2]|uniref:Uncharacterized protein n=1 Tax=Desulforapulum autotrophicum (strain ATCC 43914 / DSM 3382 / VKM B-1955 / HRM2) TaxID=177437 RepID=C0QLI0_DESAH|nr:hypothetical protein [Desulforapulum autotrophicum]ACN16284.1 hypothetical protein HRM2_32040 [Desulforapulum autotrophicum HRM2]
MPAITTGMRVPQPYQGVTATAAVTTLTPRVATKEEQTAIDGPASLNASSRSLEQEYDTKKDRLEQERNSEEQKVEAEYNQERQRLEQEYKQKRRDMGINVYV